MVAPVQRPLTPSATITAINGYVALNGQMLTEDDTTVLDHIRDKLASGNLSLELAHIVLGEVQRRTQHNRNL